jgi:hypothetical protein
MIDTTNNDKSKIPALVPQNAAEESSEEESDDYGEQLGYSSNEDVHRGNQPVVIDLTTQ